MTTANKITIARILMIPVFVMMAIYYGRSVQRGEPQDWQRWLAIAVFVVAAASDGIDGYIARRYHQRSRLGEVLDPIADKGLLLAGIITLSVSNWQYEFPLWFPVLVIARDAAIITGVIAVHFINGDTRVSPSWLGKTATVAQMIAIGCAMLFTGSEWKARIAGHEVAFLDMPVFVAGFGMATDHPYLHEKTSFVGLEATVLAAKRAYAMAGVGPTDIDMCEVHDCFTITEILDIEDLGFVEKGKGGIASLNGETSLTGRIPVNTSGGLLAKGHPIGATGIAQLTECWWQLRGDAADRQVPTRNGFALQHNVGGRGSGVSVVNILTTNL